jgi:hypothetical protein
MSVILARIFLKEKIPALRIAGMPCLYLWYPVIIKQRRYSQSSLTQIYQRRLVDTGLPHFLLPFTIQQ